MKKSIIISILACICAFGQLHAQNENTEKKISYNLINEYGFIAGNNFGFEGVFINSIKFNKTNDLLGIGLGYTIDSQCGHGFPLFLNYRHYINRGRTLQPLFNIAVGTTYYFGDNSDYVFCDTDIEIDPDYNCGYYYGNGFGLYATVASGFKVKAFSFSAGFFVRSAPHFVNNMTGGINIKVGYTF